MDSKKTRTSITIDKGLLTQAKIWAEQADQEDNITLSDVVEEALKAYLPSAIGVKRTSQGTVFVSGPTITTMKPIFTTPPGLGVPTQEEVLNSKPNTNETLGVPPLK